MPSLEARVSISEILIGQLVMMPEMRHFFPDRSIFETEMVFTLVSFTNQTDVLSARYAKDITSSLRSQSAVLHPDI